MVTRSGFFSRACSSACTSVPAKAKVSKPQPARQWNTSMPISISSSMIRTWSPFAMVALRCRFGEGSRQESLDRRKVRYPSVEIVAAGCGTVAVCGH